MFRDTDDWEMYIGEQLKGMRLRLNFSQQEAADRVGLSVNTVANLEKGKGSSLGTFIKLLQLYGKDQWLETLAPQASISPIQQFQLGHQRQRASRKKQ